MSEQKPEVLRFRVLGDEPKRCKELQQYRRKDSFSDYIRWLIDRDWAAYQRQLTRRGGSRRAA